jgi:hypothetical protein
MYENNKQFLQIAGTTGQFEWYLRKPVVSEGQDFQREIVEK